MAAHLLQLPAELLQHTAGFLDIKDIQNFRLSCKKLASAGCSALFRNLPLYPTEASRQRYSALSKIPELATQVRRVIFNTERPGFNASHHFEDSQFEKYLPHWANYRSCFRNARSATLQFDQHCWVSEPNDTDWVHKTWAERDTWRHQMLRHFFDILRENDAKSLSLVHLQNINEEQFVTAPEFQNVLKNLHTLRLIIIIEREKYAIESGIIKKALQCFANELPDVWLKPAAANLTHLTVYMDEYLGYAPKLELRGVRFPCLVSLELGKYTFSHDWQIDWITSHKTLVDLSLNKCPILYEARSATWPLDSEGYPAMNAQEDVTIPDNADEQGSWYRYSTRWKDIFASFRTGLPELRSFAFGACYEPLWIGQGPHLTDPVRMLEQEFFYVAFDCRISFCPFTDEVEEAEDDSRGPGGRQPEFDDHDKAALLELLRKTGRIVTGNDLARWMSQRKK